MQDQIDMRPTHLPSHIASRERQDLVLVVVVLELHMVFTKRMQPHATENFHPRTEYTVDIQVVCMEWILVTFAARNGFADDGSVSVYNTACLPNGSGSSCEYMMIGFNPIFCGISKVF